MFIDHIRAEGLEVSEDGSGTSARYMSLAPDLWSAILVHSTKNQNSINDPVTPLSKLCIEKCANTEYTPLSRVQALNLRGNGLHAHAGAGS